MIASEAPSGPRNRSSRRLLRLCCAAGLSLGALLLLPVVAEAHSYVLRSDPAAGASLAQVPSAVTITFSQPPDPALSSIEVLDASGHGMTRGATAPVAGQAEALTVPLQHLGNGAYTVHWRVMSRVDSHATQGTFTFGVGPSADLAGAGSPVESGAAVTAPTPLGVAGRWVYYVGLGLLVGGAWVSLFALRGAARRLSTVTVVGAVAMLAGLAAYGAAETEAARIPLAALAGTSLGRGLAAQAGLVLGACAAALVALRRPGRTRSFALGSTTALAGLSILVHVLLSHAAASRLAWLEVAAQWTHIAAFAAWIGGLAALLVAVGSSPSPAKTAAVRRFSRVAGLALGVVGVTGLVRALDEVAAWSALVSSAFGQLVLLKIALLVGLAGLGAVNHFRTVPRADRSLALLRRVGTAEVSLAAVLLVASAGLASLPPPAFARAAAAAAQPAPPRLVASGHDFGTTVRATLEASPGFPGMNRFRLELTDFDSGRAVPADVRLRFEMPLRPELGQSTLALPASRGGTYTAPGPNLSLIGDWLVTAVIQEPQDAVEVPLRLTVRPSPQLQSETEMDPDLPMAHGIALGDGRQLSANLYPGRPGRNTLHLVFESSGRPIALSGDPVVTVRQTGGPSRRLVAQRVAQGGFGQSHYVVSDTFAAGRWDLQVVATGVDGAHLEAAFQLSIQR